MQCKLCEEKLLEYLYGELSEQDSQLMDRHMEESGPCRQMCRQIQSARQIASTQGEEEPPAALHTRIMAHAREQQEKGKRRLFRAWLFHPASATLALGAIAAMVYVYAIRMGGGLPPPGASKVAEQGYLEKDRTSAELVGLAREKREEKVALPASPVLHKAKVAAVAPAGGTNEPEMNRQAVAKARGKASSSIMADDNRLDMKAGALSGEDLSEEPAELGARADVAESSVAAEKAEGGSPRDSAMPRKAGIPATGAKSLQSSVSGEAANTDEFDKDNPEVSIDRIAELTATGRCGEAMSWMYIYLARGPAEDKAGRAWMQLAQCYERKGNRKEAVDAANNALRSPSSKTEAERFLKEISSKGE